MRGAQEHDLAYDRDVTGVVNRASKQSECSEAERCGASVQSERCE